MAKILISILSDHIIPNYLFIKECGKEFDELCFVTTEYARTKEIGIHLENTLGLEPMSVRRIEVSNENYCAILKTLQTQNFSKDDTYCINQTGGTKAMSIALFSFFQEYGARFVYIPIGTNEYFDFNNDVPTPIRYRVNLREYFSLYGMTYECDNVCLKSKQYTYDVFGKLKKRNFWLNNDMKNGQLKPTADERRYWSGAWFEEYVYNRIKDDFPHLSESAVAKAVKVYRKGSVATDNEIDVAFVKDNTLHLIECKVSMTGYGDSPQGTIEKYLYKLAAIMKDLGIKVNSYLFTIHKMDRLSEKSRENLEKRRKILGIKAILSGPELINQLKF